MFPLKRRRKFARIYKKGLTATVDFGENTYDATLKDISASGCNIVIKSKDVIININDQVKINFVLNGKQFSLDAFKVRESGYNFDFTDEITQSLLNNEVLTEYFKETPELIPSIKK